MQENNKLWLEIKEMFETSQTEVTIFNGAGSDSAKICDMLRVTSASAMGAVMLNTSGVVFDDWIRLYGGDTSDRVGISKKICCLKTVHLRGSNKCLSLPLMLWAVYLRSIQANLMRA